MNEAVYRTIQRFAHRNTLIAGTTIPCVVDNDRPEGLPLLANREVRLCMADFVDLKRLAARDELGLELEEECLHDDRCFCCGHCACEERGDCMCPICH